jgi:hypothetical protein
LLHEILTGSLPAAPAGAPHLWCCSAGLPPGGPSQYNQKDEISNPARGAAIALAGGKHFSGDTLRDFGGAVGAATVTNDDAIDDVGKMPSLRRRSIRLH